MKFTKDDIHFEEISPRAFENLCYDIVIKYGFSDLIWREGGADNGRDIEATYTFSNPIKQRNVKYFIECKHYTSGGVPPEHLNSKIAWADAELPSSLIIFVSSYLTNNARTWLEKLAPKKSYDIVCIEGEELKERLVNYPEVVERYFSQGRYEQMLKDIKDYKAKFNINPSYELLKEIVENIDITKLDTEDFAFILLSYYEQYKFFETRNDFYGDFDDKLTHRVLNFLRGEIKNEVLNSFDEYKENYYHLAGDGIIEEMFWIDEEDSSYQMKKFDFQFYVLHLNHKSERDKWKIGEYLFVIFEDVAFEIFKFEKSQIKIIKDFSPEKIAELSLNLGGSITENYKKYLALFGT